MIFCFIYIACCHHLLELDVAIAFGIRKVQCSKSKNSAFLKHSTVFWSCYIHDFFKTIALMHGVHRQYPCSTSLAEDGDIEVEYLPQGYR